MFDTHCHLNSKYFEGILDEVIKRAREVGVKSIVIPGTDLPTSRRAVDIAKKHEGIYAAVGIHPHHVFRYQMENVDSRLLDTELEEIEKLLKEERVLAVGEVGLDRHYYEKTKYSDYEITEKFIQLQEKVLKNQINFARKYKKRLILHNREATKDFLYILKNELTQEFERNTVFHCCEPDDRLLEFAVKNKIYIGVDGDVTYDKKKREFVKKIPKELLVLEPDSPFLTPEPLRTNKVFPNEPKNLKLVAEYVAKLRNETVEELIDYTTLNAKTLFGISGEIIETLIH